MLHDKKGGINLLKAALLLYDKYEFLVEIEDLFGKEDLLKFLYVFSGEVIRVPKVEDVLKCIKEIRLWIYLKERNCSKEALSTLVSESTYSRKELLLIYRDVSERFERLGITLGKV